MRISVVAAEDGFREEGWDGWTVVFNGAPVPLEWSVLWADEERGSVGYYLRDASGFLVTDAGTFKVFEAVGLVNLVQFEVEAEVEVPW